MTPKDFAVQFFESSKDKDEMIFQSESFKRKIIDIKNVYGRIFAHEIYLQLDKLIEIQRMPVGCIVKTANEHYKMLYDIKTHNRYFIDVAVVVDLETDGSRQILAHSPEYGVVLFWTYSNMLKIVQ